jgi:small subunit ribosomal protein S1
MSRTPPKVGDEVEAKILDVDRRKKQIRLSIKAALPEPEEVPVEMSKPEPRKERGRKGKKQAEPVEEPESKEPELTAFQIAFQKAEERANKRTRTKKAKVDKTREQEEILSRTLENRPPTK